MRTRHTQITLLLVRPLLVPTILGKLLERTMEAQVERHAHGVAAGEPPVRAPRGEQQHALDGLLAHDGPEERRARDALRLLEGVVERRRERARARADARGDGADRVERPRRALEQTLVRVVRRVEERDEDVAAREEDVVQLAGLRVRDQSLSCMSVHGVERSNGGAEPFRQRGGRRCVV